MTILIAGPMIDAERGVWVRIVKKFSDSNLMTMRKTLESCGFYRAYQICDAVATTSTAGTRTNFGFVTQVPW